MCIRDSRYIENTYADSATIEFKSLGKSKIKELEICQKDNMGNARLSKDGSIKVQANKATSISLQLVDRGLGCNLNISLSFSANKKYFITAGAVYEKRSKLKTFIAGAKGVCKISLDDESGPDKFEQTKGVPINRSNTCQLISSNLVNTESNIVINADKWIGINKAHTGK